VKWRLKIKMKIQKWIKKGKFGFPTLLIGSFVENLRRHPMIFGDRKQWWGHFFPI